MSIHTIWVSSERTEKVSTHLQHISRIIIGYKLKSFFILFGGNFK